MVKASYLAKPTDKEIHPIHTKSWTWLRNIILWQEMSELVMQSTMGGFGSIFEDFHVSPGQFD